MVPPPIPSLFIFFLFLPPSKFGQAVGKKLALPHIMNSGVSLAFCDIPICQPLNSHHSGVLTPPLLLDGNRLGFFVFGPYRGTFSILRKSFLLCLGVFPFAIPPNRWHQTFFAFLPNTLPTFFVPEKTSTALHDASFSRGPSLDFLNHNGAVLGSFSHSLLPPSPSCVWGVFSLDVFLPLENSFGFSPFKVCFPYVLKFPLQGLPNPVWSSFLLSSMELTNFPWSA